MRARTLGWFSPMPPVKTSVSRPPRAAARLSARKSANMAPKPMASATTVQVITRIAPIEIHNNIEFPDVVIVLDESLIDVVDVAEGLKPDGTLIINTCSPAEGVKKALGVAESVTVACVDASGIALDTIKRDIPNTPIVGALIRVTGVIDGDVFKGLLAKNLSKKFGQEMIDANFAAVDRAHEEVTVA